VLPRAWSRFVGASRASTPTPKPDPDSEDASRTKLGTELGAELCTELGTESDVARPSARRIVVSVWAVLGLAALLNAPKLVRLAERRPLGGARDAALRAVRPIARASGAFSLDRPRRVADNALGRATRPDDTIPFDRVPSTVMIAARPQGSPVASLPPEAALTVVEAPGGLVVVDSTVPVPTATTTTFATSTTSPGPTNTVPTSVVPTSVVPTSVVPTTSTASTIAPTIPPTTTIVVPQPLRDPKPKIWVVGDSLVYEVGAGLATEALARHLPQPKVESKHSTGLSRPDYFNWPARVLGGLPEVDPDVTVMMVGANDPTGVIVNGRSAAYDSTAFYPEYERRVAFVMDAMGLDGRIGIWIGLPAMASPANQKWARRLDSIVAKQASVRPWITYLDPNVVLAPTNLYSPTIVRGDGTVVVVRKGDGVHLTLDGGRIVASDVMRVLLERGLGDPKKAVAPSTVVASSLAGSTPAGSTPAGSTPAGSTTSRPGR
jgi:uncharacterized protein